MAARSRVIMNAGASPVGRAFAVKNCDAFFMQSSRTSVEETAQRVAGAKAAAAEQGRAISVFTVGVVTCRPTMKEARGVSRPCAWSIRPTGPRSTICWGFATSRRRPCRRRSSCASAARWRTATAACRWSAIPITSRAQLIELSGAGLTGIAVSLVNYADELPYFRDEVLPRLERAGLRVPA